MIPFFGLRQYARHNRVADNTSCVSVILSRKRFLQSDVLVHDGSFPCPARIIDIACITSVIGGTY